MQDADPWALAASVLVHISLDRPGKAAENAKTLLAEHGGDMELASWIKANELSLLFQTLTDGFRGLDGRGVKALKRDAEETLRRARSMARLIQVFTEAFERRGIEYVIFKTFNRLMRVDVDVDVLIPKDMYLEAVKALLDAGFQPIDDLSKTYATGLMLPGNPIVLDLHTEITVLGTPYFNHQILLKEKTETSQELGGIVLTTYTPSPTAEAAVRIAHAVIKEAEIRADDISETLKTIIKTGAKLNTLIQKQNLTLAYQTYIQILKNTVSKKLRNLPIKIPEKQRMKALIDKAKRDGLLTQLTMSLTNLRYRRSAAMVGRLIAEEI